MINKKLWSGRFQANTHPAVESYTASISFDVILIQEDILGSLAHVNMLHRCQIIKTDEYHKIKQGLLEIAKEMRVGEINFRLEDEDIHMNIERLLHQKIGDVAGKLHTARSRNDQVALDMHLYLRKQLLTTLHLILQIQKTLLNRVEEDGDVILPGYTHLQRAQPVYLATHWMAYIAMFQRDIDRLKDNWKRMNQCPLGAAALAGSTFGIDREYIAIQLGFDGSYLNTMDAVSDRDFIIEFLATASLIMMHLSRLSEELILWSSQEFGFINFADEFTTGSSIMPQKKNPDVVELARGKTGRVYGSLMSVLTLMKGLPLAYNKDLQEDKEPLFDTVKTLQATLSIYSSLLTSIQINKKVMLSATTQGFLNATALAEYLVKKGMPFRMAHEVSGRMVSFCINKDCKLEDLSLQEMQQFSKLIDESVLPILEIKNIVKNLDTGQQSYPSLIEVEKNKRNEQILETECWWIEKNKIIHNSERFFLGDVIITL